MQLPITDVTTMLKWWTREEDPDKPAWVTPRMLRWLAEADRELSG